MENRMPLGELMGVFLQCLNDVQDRAAAEHVAKVRQNQADKQETPFGHTEIPGPFIDATEWSFSIELKEAEGGMSEPDAGFPADSPETKPLPGSTDLRMSIRWKD
jgi:hypothetical protein